MKPEDIKHVEKLMDETSIGLESNGKVLLFCPSSEEIELATRKLSGCEITVLDRSSWDLMNEPPEHFPVFDMVLMCNVFMYSQDPVRWLSNISKKCKWLLIQDIIRAKRMPDAELGSDGDSSRYGFPTYGEIPRIDYFNLEDYDVMDVIFYSDGDGPGGADCRKFVALIGLRE